MDRSNGQPLARIGQGVSSPLRRGWLKAFSSLRNQNYRWFWLGILGSFNAMQMQTVAQGWLVYEMTDSPLALGIVSAAWGLPVLLFSLFGGVIVDRMEKRNLLIITQSSIFLTNLTVAFLITIQAVALWHLVAASLLSGIIFAFNMPGRQAFMVDLVGEQDLFNAIALNSTAMNVCRIASPALAGVLVGFVGTAGVYWIIVASHAWAIITLLMIPLSGAVVLKPNVSLRDDLKEGLHFVRENSIIVALMAVAFVPILVAMPYQMLMPVFARDVLQSGSTGLGLLMSAVGTGALIGSLVIASLGNFQGKGKMLLMTGILFGVALILFSVSKSMFLALLFLIFVGAGSSSFMTANNTLLMTNTPKELVGRVMSIYMITWGLMPLGTLPAGAVANVFGAPLTVVAGGAILTLFLLAVAVAKPRIRQLA